MNAGKPTGIALDEMAAMLPHMEALAPLLTRFCHAETAARPCFLSHFCPGFVPVWECLAGAPHHVHLSKLVYFWCGFGAVARAFSFAHRERRKHKNSPGTPARASGLFACRGSKCPCGAFYVSLEDFHDSTQK